MEEHESPLANSERVLAELAKTNALLEESMRQRADWKLALRQGLMTGLGSVLGATVLVSVLVWALQPLQRLEVLKPTLDRIATQLERGSERK